MPHASRSPRGGLPAEAGPGACRRQPARRWRGRTPAGLHIEAIWPDHGNVTPILDRLDTLWDERLIRISQHDLVQVGPDRDDRWVRSRQVLRADTDGPDRWVLVHHVDTPDASPPSVRALRHCRTGRVIHDRENGYLVAELLFDRVLTRGETIVTEHLVEFSEPYPFSDNFERKLRFPAREYVLEVAFDPAALPIRCHQYVAPAMREPERVRALELDASNCVHAVQLDCGPGLYGIRWDWA